MSLSVGECRLELAECKRVMTKSINHANWVMGVGRPMDLWGDDRAKWLKASKAYAKMVGSESVSNTVCEWLNDYLGA